MIGNVPKLIPVLSLGLSRAEVAVEVSGDAIAILLDLQAICEFRSPNYSISLVWVLHTIR